MCFIILQPGIILLQFEVQEMIQKEGWPYLSAVDRWRWSTCHHTEQFAKAASGVAHSPTWLGRTTLLPPSADQPYFRNAGGHL